MVGHWFILVLYLLVCGTAMSGIHLTKFVSNLSLGDYICKPGNVILELALRTVMFCFSQCSEHGTCLSVFYNSNSELCVLCNSPNPVVSDQPAQLRFTCYNRIDEGGNTSAATALLGEDCSDNNCLLRSQECFPPTLRCMCRQLKQYNRTSGKCDKDCINHGNGYQKYIERIPDRTSYDNCITPSATECHSKCSGSNITCNGVAYSTITGDCWLYEKTAHLLESTMDTYTRECV